VTRTIGSPLYDRELVDLLADDPELLAIADALVETRRARLLKSGVQARGHTRLRRRGVIPVGAALAAAAVIAFLLISPWQSTGGDFVQRALAAIGNGPVVHAVIEQQAGYGQLVDLSTGQAVAEPVRAEVWFDGSRNIEAVRTTISGQTLDQMLDTPQGGWTTGGAIITCAWIAAHPAEAAKARVNCDAGTQTGGSQQVVVDPAIAGFVDHYRALLASGDATVEGSGTYDGRQVTWLELTVKSPFPDQGPPLTERVAIDSATSMPVVVENTAGETLFQIVDMETVARNAADFARPSQVDRVTGSSVISTTATTAADAAASIGGQAAWLGQSTPEVQLVGVQKLSLNVGYGPLSSRPSYQVAGAEFDYEAASGPAKKLTLSESSSCAPGWGWMCNAADPQPGYMLVRGPLALVRYGSLYVTIWNWDRWSAQDLAQFAGEFQPLTP